MKFIVRGTKYEFDQERLTFAEARAMERVTGMTFGEIGEAADKGDMACVQAFLWVAMKRTDPALKFVDLDDIPIGELERVPEEEPAAEPDPTQPAPEPEPAPEPAEPEPAAVTTAAPAVWDWTSAD